MKTQTIEVEVKFVKTKCSDSNDYTYKPVFDEKFEGTNLKLKSGVKIKFRGAGYFTVREVSVGGKVTMWLTQDNDVGKPSYVQEMFDALGVENTNAEVITATFKGKTCLL